MDEAGFLNNLEKIYSDTQMVGWDFSVLDRSLEVEGLPWDFEVDCLSKMQQASSVLDVGTGGGERLISLIKSLSRAAGKPYIAATEGWEPNVKVARANLKPFGVECAAYDPDSRQPSTFRDSTFDVIMNRHESLDAVEIARLLAPGGEFMTQQVDGHDVPELHQWFGADYEYPEVGLENFCQQLEQAGLTITCQESWEGYMRFSSVEALVTYLALVPWDVPGFNVSDHASTLLELQRAPKPIEVTQRRFRVYAMAK
ncbi:hypothetical protein CAQU_05605 [Corynebacterium aquilae DSM 44791]|uniref:Methyltransferase type 11 domain-containing protein n=2 Tax=Corynebacterium aquilae TaxID=203263 RepID=A0A1L7CFI0_9CORY|nr:hypothetical protein CAQU_05605 [Corynebacterium aquilae DSM 44791]